jgi:3-phenylpropionate/cinnamic acid dioxygenase small subunit
MAATREAVALSRAEAEDFLYAEAALLDEGRLEEWLELFTDDAHYWLPPRRDAVDPDDETSLVYDDRHRLGDRIWRLTQGPAHAQIPPSRTQRVIGNVETPVADGDELVVRSAFSLFEYRKGNLRTFAGRCEHRLRPRDGGLGIVLKRVDLVNAEAPIYNLTFVL